MNAEKRRKRRIRNLVCATYCFLQMLLVIGAFQLLGNLLKRIPVAETMEPINAEIIFGYDEEEPEETGVVICIDAGHGGKDNGSDYQRRYEKDDNLKLAQAVAAYLRGKDIKVVMTREEDVFLSLEERCKVANESQAVYFVSLHRNDGDGNGVETWVNSGATDETVTLAETIMQKLDAVGISRNRGVKKGTQNDESGDYYVNLHSDMPSCIVEMGFMNSSADNQLFDEKLDAYAAAIGDAILETYGIYHGQPGEEGDAAGETGTTAPLVKIENIESLDSTCQDWGQGTNVDEKNRPVSAVAAQEQYGKYQAMFIGEETNTIYLTFDEGYEYGYSPSILDTLKEKDVKAVFFVTQPYAQTEHDLVQRMITEGHVVGNHSVTHPAKGLPSQSLEQQEQEIMGNHQYIQENYGYTMHLFRYPAGKYSEQSLALMNNCGYKSVFWSFAYVDYDVNNQPDQTESLNKMVDKLHPGAIYLLHAESETNAAVLGEFIDQARAKGYEFALLN